MSRRLLDGPALAVSWLTVLPARVRTGPDGALPPGAAASALRWAPVVGVLLGLAGGGLLLGLTTLGVAPFVAGLLVVGAGALGTRGMHLDGLADTADGLGSYGPPERALTVMADGGAGPFAVVTLVVLLGARAGALAQLSAGSPLPVLVACALAAATGRAGFCWVARRGVPAARPGGLGATVAGSQPAWVAPVWWGALAVLAAVGLGVLGGGPPGPAAAPGPSVTVAPGAMPGPGAATAVGGVAAGSGVAAEPGGVSGFGGGAAGVTVPGSGGWPAGPVIAVVVAVGIAAVLVVGLAAHTRRRLGGMSGDVLGAASELGTTAVLIVLAAALT